MVSSGQLASNRLSRLKLRAAVTRAVRTFFEQRDYLEVDTPSLVQTPGLEPEIDAQPVADAGYLITSPEFHLKRLLVSGPPRIFTLCHCWRRGELGRLHLPEFTMLEWYRVGATLEDLMDETESLVASVACATANLCPLGGLAPPLDRPFQRTTVAEAFWRYAKIDLVGVASTPALKRAAGRAGITVPPTTDFTELFSWLWVEKVEPSLAKTPAIFIHDFPAPLAALARLRPEDSTVAERFELYVGGVELANAFWELRDADEQIERFLAEQAARKRRGLPVYPIDHRFISALRQGLPDCCGIALGLDRLVMLAAGADAVDQVVAFPPNQV